MYHSGRPGGPHLGEGAAPGGVVLVLPLGVLGVGVVPRGVVLCQPRRRRRRTCAKVGGGRGV